MKLLNDLFVVLKKMNLRYLTMKISKLSYKSFIIILSVLGGFSATAQVTTYPVGNNAAIENFLFENPTYTFQPNLKNKFGTRDTLQLPFFDDFSESKIYPDSTKWLNNQVYVNNSFPKRPPTLNVATFDALDTDGRPYRNTINKDLSAAGDSLISQPINLKDSSGFPYALSDSIMLSFFYQPNGYGYHLNSEDSLRLFFKAENGNWIQMWSVGGQANSEDFMHVIIPILDTNFLHEGFQFAFTTYTRQVGNANHWHIDYVLLDNDRSVNIDYYNDYAIQTTPGSLLRNYSSMPYSHFSVDAAGQTATDIDFRISNLNNGDKALQVRHQSYFNSSELVNTLFSVNINNINAQDDTARSFLSYSISGLSGTEPIVINRTIFVRENGLFNDYQANDSIQVQQIFDDYYAYDDGSAERGFGFDQNTNPSNIQGQIALGFDVLKQDRLYAIGTYFNEAVFDVSSRRFKYRVWKALNGVDGAPSDSIIYESDEMTPEYRTANGKRTFSPHYLDTNIVLTPGRYYIGWWQQDMFNLNVGWDMNYGNIKNPEVSNPKLYYNTFGIWKNTDLPNGTLMMRPHFGDSVGLYLGINDFNPKSPNPKMYPNPARDMVHFDKEFDRVSITTITGEVLIYKEETDFIRIEGVQSGIYFVKLQSETGEQFTMKLVILAP
ncbi:MAG: hypothetical protein COA58_07070 [Bacteroidetes bacterium]|nr:MAG: hypothetical protein COA58_07070 [Bacteroidota bacterium]